MITDKRYFHEAQVTNIISGTTYQIRSDQIKRYTFFLNTKERSTKDDIIHGQRHSKFKYNWIKLSGNIVSAIREAHSKIAIRKNLIAGHWS